MQWAQNRYPTTNIGDIRTNVTGAARTLQSALNSAGNPLDKYLTGLREQEKQKAMLAQQGLQNKRAEASLLLQQESAKRDADKYARDVAGDTALNTYAQQLGNYGSDVVPEADAMAIQKAYDVAEASGVPKEQAAAQAQTLVDAAQSRYNANTAEGAQSRIDMLNQVAMPSGGYDPTKLLDMQEKAVAKPQSTLDAIVSERTKEQVRQQGLKDRMNLAMFKEGIKTVKPAAKVDEYNRLLSGGVPEDQARLLVWGDKSGSGSSSDKSGKTFSLDPKATDINLDFFGSGDTQKAIDIGQKLQDSFGLKTPEVTALLQQSIGGFLDKSLETDKLAKALKSSGLVKTSYYKDVKTGDIKPMDGVMMAEALQNPDIVIRTNEDGSRVFIDEGKEREKLRKLNEFNRPVATTPIQNVDNKTTSPLGYYPELMP